MQTANRLGPTRVGVAPGTTTFQLAGPQGPCVDCEADPARTTLQKLRLWPAGKYRAKTPTVAEMATGGTAAGGPGYLNPYATIEGLKGASSRPGFFARLKRRLGLGLVLAPYGNISPNPYSEAVGAGKRMQPTCRGCREQRGPSYHDNYQQASTVAYRPFGSEYGPNLAGPRLGAVYPETPGGGVYPQPQPTIVPSQGPPIVPTDMQLSTQWGYTPVMSQWIPFKEGNYPAPWTPPAGQPAPALAGPTATFGRAGLGDTPLPPEARAIDPAAATIEVLRQHQDRMYTLGIVSAMAVAGTALVNVARYANERRDVRKRSRKVAAEPAAMISGSRR